MSATFAEYYRIYGLVDACWAFLKDSSTNWKEEHPEGLLNSFKNKIYSTKPTHIEEDYTHLYR